MDLDNLSIADAKDVQTNSQNEYHRAYASNDKKIVEAVSKAYQRGVSGSLNLSNVVEDEAAAPPSADPGAAPTPPEQNGDWLTGVPPEVARTEAEVQQTFQVEWGADFQQNSQLVAAHAQEIFGTKERFLEYIRKNNLDTNRQKQEEAARFLFNMTRGK
jgi:hypothetical protein